MSRSRSRRDFKIALLSLGVSLLTLDLANAQARPPRIAAPPAESATAPRPADAQVAVPAGATILATKGYALVDLFASYAVNDRIKADFILQNAFDKRYTQYLNALASPGLVAKAAISIRFATR